MASDVRIGILGPLEARVGFGEPVEVAGPRLRTLLVRPAPDPDRVVLVSQLVVAVWGEEPPAQAANALQSLVSRLRRLLPDVVGSHPAGYRLALDAAAEAGFAEPAAVRLEALRLGALEDRIEADLALGADDPVAELDELVAQHPHRERLHGQLMRALARAGRQADALAAYERLRVRLADELGVDPSEELRAVHLAVLRGEVPPAAAGQAPQVPPPPAW